MNKFYPTGTDIAAQTAGLQRATLIEINQSHYDRIIAKTEEHSRIVARNNNYVLVLNIIGILSTVIMNIIR